jgi:hypothetical protein
MNKSEIIEYEAGLLKACPKPRIRRYMRSSQNTVLEPIPAKAPFQMKHPMTMILRRLLLSAARPMKRPATTNVAENPYPVRRPYSVDVKEQDAVIEYRVLSLEIAYR